MSKDQRVIDRVWQDVEKANANFGQWEKVKKIIIIRKSLPLTMAV